MLTVAEAIQQRRSTRSFTRESVSKEMIIEMLEAARMAPSASNSQPWRFIAVTDIEEKKRLRQLCFNQMFIEEAGVDFIACADLSSYAGKTMKLRRQEAVDAGVFPASSLEDPGFVARVEAMEKPDPITVITPAVANTYIAVEHLVLMATALGLGSCWVGAIEDMEKVKELLGIPKDIVLVTIVAVGHTRGVPPVRPHLSMDEILLRPVP